jgi:integrase
MGIGINKLTDLTIKSLKPGKHFDGSGLFLLVTPHSKLWRLKYRFAGKEKLLALGKYPMVSLKEARNLRDDAKRQIAKGIDPAAQKSLMKAQSILKAQNSVDVCSQAWFSKMTPQWGEGTRFAVQSSFRRDVIPYLGNKPIAELNTLEILTLVKRVEQRGACDQAKRLLMRLTAFFRWAVVNQIIQTNPASNLKPSEVLMARKVIHRPSLQQEDLAEFLTRLDKYTGNVVTAIGVRVLMHTAMRPGEVRGLRWSDIDFENSKLSIPAERMKMGRPFRVPLTQQVIELLKSLTPINGHRQFVFASMSVPTKPISENTLNLAIKRLGYEATSHGMRSTFSTIANESQNFTPDAIEAALSHEIGNKIRTAYARSDYFEQRIPLMRWWSNYLDAVKNQKQLALQNTI